MANEIISTEDSTPTVGWTKLVTKAGDIVRHQKTNMKVPSGQTYDNRHGVLTDTTQNNRPPIDTFAQIDDLESEDEVPTYKLLALKLDRALRDAKQKTLQCEMLVPCDLTLRVAQDIIRMSEYEPCGLRGCMLHLNLEDTKKCSRKLGKMKCDSDSIATFELHLTLRQDASAWFGLKHLVSSRLLKKVPAIVVHEGYTLSKKKLYRSSSLD